MSLREGQGICTSPNTEGGVDAFPRVFSADAKTQPQ
jgi:hypothetical protein